VAPAGRRHPHPQNQRVRHARHRAHTCTCTGQSRVVVMVLSSWLNSPSRNRYHPGANTAIGPATSAPTRPLAWCRRALRYRAIVGRDGSSVGSCLRRRHARKLIGLRDLLLKTMDAWPVPIQDGGRLAADRPWHRRGRVPRPAGFGLFVIHTVFGRAACRYGSPPWSLQC
jgi:hypothetical protein